MIRKAPAVQWAAFRRRVLHTRMPRRASSSSTDVLPRKTDMTKEDLAEAVRRLVGYYADEGAGRKTILAEIEDMAQAMREALD